MVNLTIRLNAKGSGGETSTPTKTAVEGPGTPKLVCGGHLIQAELPTASGLGLISDLAAASTPSSGYLGYKVRRTAGDKVHFCVRCHFPIAIYGRLVEYKKDNSHVWNLRAHIDKFSSWLSEALAIWK